MTKTLHVSSLLSSASGLLATGLLASACTTLHLPEVYLRASVTPGSAEAVAFDMGLVGPLGEVDPPEPLGDEAPSLAPTFGPSTPCRVSAACAWERRAVAEARARVIGGQP